MTLADRLVVLNGGRIEQMGARLEIYHRSASTFVASFIGSPAMNLLDAEVSSSRLRIVATVAALPFRVAAEGSVTLGIRAEALHPAPAATSAGLPFVCDFVEELGARRLVHGHVEGQPLTFALSPQAALSQHFTLTVPLEALHFFDTASGRRLALRDAARQMMELPA